MVLPSLHIARLRGMTSYSKGLQLQQYFSSNLLKNIADSPRKVRNPDVAVVTSSHYDGNSGQNMILLLEHKPVYTVGLRSKGYSNELEEKLRKTGAEYYKTNRGGLITFHGPGQLVAYPIIYLKEFDLTMRSYITKLELATIKLCASYGIKGECKPETGVWVGDNKIASIGVHGSRFVTTHGIGINCNTDLSWFDHIVPCGIEDKGVTSISKEVGRNITVDEAVKTFVKAFQEIFSCNLKGLDSIYQHDHV